MIQKEERLCLDPKQDELNRERSQKSISSTWRKGITIEGSLKERVTPKSLYFCLHL